MTQIIAIFEAKDYSEENPEIGLKVMSLMNEVSFPPNYNPGGYNTESARNRCKSMVPRQRRLWVNSHQGWRWERMECHSSPESVA